MSKEKKVYDSVESAVEDILEIFPLFKAESEKFQVKVSARRARKLSFSLENALKQYRKLSAK